MPREKLYERKTDVRTARVFVVACEGEHTESLYFTALVEGLRRVTTITLPAFEGLSAPEQVFERLNEFAAKRGLTTFEATTGGGELWMVIDVDRWFADNRIRVTHHVLDQAAQRGYEVAISNKCFEVWLLYHFEEVAAHSTVHELEERLRVHLGGYAKNKLDFEKYRPHIAAAIQRAKEADATPEQREPAHPGSRVYRLLEAMQVACGVTWPYCAETG
jgi:hypothetical protein